MVILTVLCLVFRFCCCVVSENSSLEDETPVTAQNYPSECQKLYLSSNSSKPTGDKEFFIKISGNPTNYEPNELYIITLGGKCGKTFVGFWLSVDPVNTRNNPSVLPDVGSFQLLDDKLSKHSQECPNTIANASDVRKKEIMVVWQAPSAGVGCVMFRSTVQENREAGYIDEGGLIRELCEEVEQENQDEQPKIIQDCCACDDAEYEVTFEGLWSRHTHPKEFPTRYEWLTHFSDIIGSSHTVDFRIWDNEGVASEGVKEVAERGITERLESELNAESNKIRTIIKARGLWYPNEQGKTFAVFRVDRFHHLMSLLTKLGPSPDWFVGVSALELCLKNCSWVAEKVMNLYPWDAGTDSGITYISQTFPTVPQEKIRKITSSSPNDPLSPFYDPSGAPMKPIAKLTVTRKLKYEKYSGDYDHPSTSTTTYSSEDEGERMECRVTEWSDFQPCSVSCGQGVKMRSREYLDILKADIFGCTAPLVDEDICNTSCVSDVSCRTTEWDEWSQCSVTCGEGLRTRSRKYLDNRARNTCVLELTEKETCMGMEHVCEVEEKHQDSECAVTQWSEWSQCTKTCGNGLKFRSRLYLSPTDYSICNVEVFQKESCTVDKCPLDPRNAKYYCMLPKKEGPCRGYFPRWYYDTKRAMCVQFIYGGCRGLQNNFETYEDCNRYCEKVFRGNEDSLPTPFSEPTTAPHYLDQFSDPIDCELSEWSEWSPCSSTCGKARRTRKRSIVRKPENGGYPCQKLKQSRKCISTPKCEKEGYSRK